MGTGNGHVVDNVSLGECYDAMSDEASRCLESLKHRHPDVSHAHCVYAVTSVLMNLLIEAACGLDDLEPSDDEVALCASKMTRALNELVHGSEIDGVLGFTSPSEN